MRQIGWEYHYAFLHEISVLSISASFVGVGLVGAGGSLVARCKVKCKVKDCRREALKLSNFKIISGTMF